MTADDALPLAPARHSSKVNGMRLAAVLVLALAIGCGAGSTTPGSTPSPSARPSATPSASPAPTPSSTTTPTRSPRPSGTPAAAGLPRWLADGVVTRLPTYRRVVALTFDGGAGAQGAPRIVSTLLAEHVPATFFLTGAFVQTHTAFVMSLARDGFLIGNHSTSHPHMNRLSPTDVVSEVVRGGEITAEVIGKPTKPWFRFPFGEYDAGTLTAIHHLGYGAIGWTVDSRGWQGRAAGTATDVVERVRNALEPGAIVLMHLGANPDDGTTFDADALPAVIDAVRAAGYEFVTLANGRS